MNKKKKIKNQSERQNIVNAIFDKWLNNKLIR
jgi:hypothetical protein